METENDREAEARNPTPLERAVEAVAAASVALREALALAGGDPGMPTPCGPTLDPAEAGRRLRLARVRAGHETIMEAAARSGVAASQISRYERGDALPGWGVLHQLAVTLKLDPRILFPEMLEIETAGDTPTIAVKAGRRSKSA